MRQSAQVAENCLRLHKSGFIPDVIYATAQAAYAHDVRDLFPHARLATRLEWACSPKTPPLVTDATPAQAAIHDRLCNALQLMHLGECAVGIVSSHWQKAQFPHEFDKKLCMIANGVDTHFFAPSGVLGTDAGTALPKEEHILFSCHGTNPLRGIHTITHCLPEVLALRPQCRVTVVSFASQRSEAGRLQHTRELTALMPPLTDAQQKRVAIVVSPPREVYLALLQQSALYVYLTPPPQMSAGLLEAMSCGTLVLASDTESVREIVRHGENGLLWGGTGAQGLAFAVAEAVATSKDVQNVRHTARETILAAHDMRVLLPHHAAAVLGV